MLSNSSNAVIVLSFVSNMAFMTPSVRAATLAEIRPVAAFPCRNQRYGLDRGRQHAGRYGRRRLALATAPPPTPPPVSARPCRASRFASIVRPSCSRLARVPSGHRVAGPLPCGSCPPDRTGRWRAILVGQPAQLLVEQGLQVASRGLARSRLPVRASHSSAFPALSSWRLSPSP